MLHSFERVNWLILWQSVVTICLIMVSVHSVGACERALLTSAILNVTKLWISDRISPTVDFLSSVTCSNGRGFQFLMINVAVMKFHIVHERLCEAFV